MRPVVPHAFGTVYKESQSQSLTHGIGGDINSESIGEAVDGEGVGGTVNSTFRSHLDPGFQRTIPVCSP